MALTRTQREQRNAQIFAAYKNGGDEEQVAARFDLTIATIEKILQKAHVGVRGGHNHRVHRKTYEGSATVRALAGSVGVSYGIMYNGLTDAGTNFRRHGGQSLGVHVAH